MALAAALLGVAGLLLAALWPRVELAGAPSGAPATASVSPPPPPPPPGVGTGPPAPDAVPEAVQRYREATVYPPTSGRLTTGHADLLHPNRRHERPRPLRETLGADPADVTRVLLTADRYYVEEGEPVRATLDAWRGREPVPDEIDVREASLVREGRRGAEGAPAAVAFVRRAEHLEAELPLERFHDHHGPVRLDVEFRVGAEGERQEETLRFFHTPSDRIPARLTGELRDAVRGGSLRIEVGIDVRDPGFYRLDANVFGAAGQPVAFGSFKGELGRGVQFVPIEVYGKVLRDAGIAGPYELRDVRGYRFLDGDFPDRERIDAPAVSHVTAPWPLEAFRADPWTSPAKRRTIDLMLEDAARGIAVEAPALPGAASSGAPRAPDEDFEPLPPPKASRGRGGR